MSDSDKQLELPRSVRVPTKRVEVRFVDLESDNRPRHFAIMPFNIADGWAAVGGTVPWDDQKPIISASHESMNAAVEDVFATILAQEAIDRDMTELELRDENDQEGA